MPAVLGDVDGAQVSYEKLQLTSGTADLPDIIANRVSTELRLQLESNASKIVDRVIYCIFKKSSGNQLMLVNSAIVSDAGENGDFLLETSNIAGDLAIYAYGIKDTNASASATFGNYKVTNASDVATLVNNRSISSKDFIFTKTRGTTLFSGEVQNVIAGENQVVINLYAGANGSVSVKVGEGQAEIVNSGKSFKKAVDKGSTILFKGMPDIGWEIKAWKDNRNGSTVSTETSYTVNNVQDAVDLSASFKEVGK